MNTPNQRLMNNSGFDPLIGMATAERRPTMDPLKETLNSFDQKIALGTAMEGLSNTERYQLSNPNNAAYSAAGAAPGSSAAASSERQTNSIMSTLRDNIATQRATTPPTATMQPVAGAPTFADGGVVTSEADEYARQAAEIEAEQLRQAGVKKPAEKPAAPAPAPEKPKSLLGGIFSLTKKRNAELDKAANYAGGGEVGRTYPSYSNLTTEAESVVGGRTYPSYNNLTPEEPVAVSKAPPTAPTPSAPTQPTAASAPTPSNPSVASVATEPSAAPSAAKAPNAGQPRMGGVPNYDSTRWTTESGLQGPGNTAADVRQATAQRAASPQGFAEEVKTRVGATPPPKPAPDYVMENMDGKGPRPVKGVPEAPAAAPAQKVAPVEPVSKSGKSFGAGKAAGSVTKTAASLAKQAAISAPLAGFGDYQIVGDEVDSSAAGTLGYLKDGEFSKAGDSLKKGAVEAGLDSLSGVAKTGDFVTGLFGYKPRWADRLAGNVKDRLGAMVTTPLDAPPEDSAAPVRSPYEPGTADAPLERVATVPTGQPAIADPRFTPDSSPAPMPSGAIRVGPATGAVSGTATASAEQFPAPERGGYVTGQDGRALFVPGAPAPARDPNGSYDAYGNNMAATNQMKTELRNLQRAGFEADLQSALPYYQARGMRGLTALNSDPDVAAENAQALEQTRAQNRTAELQTQAGLEGIAAQELTSQLQGVTDPAKRQALIDQATATKGRYTLVQDEETETPMGTKLKGRQRIWDNKLGRYADDGRQEQAAAPTADEVAILKKNNSPAFIKVFEEKYGKGAAEKALRGFAHGGVITPDMYLGKEMSVEPPNLLDSAGKAVDSLPYAAAQFIPGAGVPLGAAAAAVHAAQGRTEELPLDAAAMIPGGKGVMLAKGAKLAAKRAIGGVGRAANTIQALGAADAFGSPAYANGGCIKLANGGEVIQGAGSGTSDSVAAHVAETGQPIRVSQGEYELSPEVVARVGVEKLNALIDKYHKGESRAVPQGSFIIPADVVNRLGRSYFDYLAKPK